jgi:hypothetical protein
MDALRLSEDELLLVTSDALDVLSCELAPLLYPLSVAFPPLSCITSLLWLTLALPLLPCVVRLPL